MVDIEELRGLAEKATPGPWWVDSHGMCIMSMESLSVVFHHENRTPPVRHQETGNLSSWNNDWDASFIAAANPAAVLELIAELERFRAEALHITAENMKLRAEVEALRNPKTAHALHAAVGAIYFDDSSDFGTALWEVVRHLAPDLVDELEESPSAVWHKTEALAAKEGE